MYADMILENRPSEQCYSEAIPLSVGLNNLEFLSKEILKLAGDLLQNLDSLFLELNNVLLDRVNRFDSHLGFVRALGQNISVVARTTTVPGEGVDGVRRNVGEGILKEEVSILRIHRRYDES